MEITSPDSLIRLMYLAAFLSLNGLKSYHLPLIGNDTINVTQRKRYTHLVTGQLMTLPVPVFILMKYGTSAYWTGIQECWWVTPGLSAAAAANVIAIVSPIMTALCALYVYVRPSAFAYKSRKRGVYYLTSEVRAGLKIRQTFQLP